MTSRRLLLAGGGASFAPPPPPPRSYLAAAHNNDYAGGGSFDNYLHGFTSDDGLAWTPLAANTAAASLYPSATLRDPGLLYSDGTYWIAANAGATSFPVLSCDTFDGTAFTLVHNVDCSSVSGLTQVWAPSWFVDVDDSIHVLFCSATSSQDLYEVHPTNSAMTTWSTPTQITGTGFATGGSGSIDPNLTYYDGTYYLMWKNNGTNYMCLSVSSSPFSGYTTPHTGNWASWGTGLEGPKVVDTGSSWRVYFTANSGYEALHVYYSETSDRTMATGWSTKAVLSDFDGYNHPLPIVAP